MVFAGIPEYGVTLITGQTGENELYVEGVEKTHLFETEEESLVCFKHLRHIVKNRPLAALEQFNRYKKNGKVPLSKCVGHTKRVRHCVKRPNGTKSYWNATLSGEKIVLTTETHTMVFSTLGAFASAHYKAEHPTRKIGKGWEECETIIYGEWVKMAVMREVNA
jgi:hypothetical protein